MNKCILNNNKDCNNCGECDKCDVFPNKICDNCGACIRDERDFASIQITKIVDPTKPNQS